MRVITAARWLIEQRPAHPVLSLHLDLDPERFATPSACASQIRSLLDGGRTSLLSLEPRRRVPG